MTNEQTYTRVYKTQDKSTWGPGPWQDEPDKLQWVDDTSDLDCLIVRNHHGSLCGYVGVPPGHPRHGSDYDDVPVSVHGGLTFAGGCDEDAPEGHGICHVPEPGRPADVWWLGFDCGHWNDLAPAMRERERSLGLPDSPWGEGSTYRDVPYVRAECEQLAMQLAQHPRCRDFT